MHLSLGIIQMYLPLPLQVLLVGGQERQKTASHYSRCRS